MMELRLTEEVMLLALHNENGEFAEMRDWPLHCALAGGLLMDLLLEGRIAAKPGLLRAVDSDPLGDPLLDPALTEIAAADPPRDPRHWVDHFARQAERLRDEALGSLVGRGILRRESGLFLWVHGPRRYPATIAEMEAKLRIWGVLLENEEPAPRDVALIHLAHACHILRKLLPHLQLQQAAKRIEEVCGLDEAGATVLDAVMDSEVAAGPSHGQPIAKGLPIVDNLPELYKGNLEFLPQQYVKYGPVFQLRIGGRDTMMLAGPEANRFVIRHDARYLRRFEIWNGIAEALGGKHFMLSIDGPEHGLMRQAHKEALSRNFGQNRIPDIVDATRRRMAAWPTGEPIPAKHELFRFMAGVQGRLHLGTSVREYEDDLVEFVDAIGSLRVSKHVPKYLAPVKYPHYEQKRERVQKLFAETVRQRRMEPREDGPKNYLDGMLALHEEDPRLMSEADFPAAMILPLLAGIDTIGSTLAFMLHGLFEDPDLMARATAEADELFANGTPTPQAAKKMDVLRRLMLEALRMYPPLYMLGYWAINTFDFGGYRIPAGERIVLASTVAHFLPEFYPDPLRFDIDRYLPERMENSVPGTYAPFGLGSHACLGAGLAQIQVPLTMATLLHGLELEGTVDRGSKMPLKFMPTLCPGDAFAFRIRQRR